MFQKGSKRLVNDTVVRFLTRCEGHLDVSPHITEIKIYLVPVFLLGAAVNGFAIYCLNKPPKIRSGVLKLFVVNNNLSFLRIS